MFFLKRGAIYEISTKLIGAYLEILYKLRQF